MEDEPEQGPESLLPYDDWAEEAMRHVVVRALRHAAEHGLPGEHHFYLTFRTDHPAVVIPPRLRAQYPQEMTIVLQHQYWDLEIGEDRFAVTLSFQKQLERLIVPFAAVRSFADPSVNFALEFADPEAKPAASDNVPMPLAAPPAPAGEPPAAPAEKPAAKPTGEVVALDSFRKR
jgi:uncharacterized protein